MSETQKYGHVTYFWNGNRSGKVDESLEDYEEVPSDVIPFEQAPAMKSKEITDCMVEAMASNKYQFLRCNYPERRHGRPHRRSERCHYRHGVPSTQGVARVMEAADKYGYTVLVTADHGNADQMTRNEEGQDQRPHRALPEPRSLHHLRSRQQV